MGGGKIFSSAVLTVLLVTAVVGSIGSYSAGKGSSFSTILAISVGSTAVVFLLNIAGLWFGQKSYGIIGTLISGAILGYGIYVLNNNDSGLGLNKPATDIVGGVSTGVGAVGVLSSLGVISANL